MTTAISTSKSPPPLPAKPALEPAFARALQGLWAMTWKARFNWRRVPALLVTLAVVPLLAYSTLGYVEPGNFKPFYNWTVDFYLLLLVPLYCLSVCGGMIREEIASDTLRFLITRPITRFQLLLAKYLCQMALLQAFALICGLLLLVAGKARHIPDLSPFAWRFLGIQVLAVAAYAALSSLLGIIHQRYLLIGILYGFIVELGIGRIPTNINNLSLSRHLRTLLANNPKIVEFYDWSPDHTPFSIMMLLLGTIIFLGVAGFLFTFREHHQNEEMQK